MKTRSKKIALVHIGNDEVYGLLFVAGELLKQDFQIQWFDGDCEGVVDQIVRCCPDYVFFSPLMVFFEHALRLSKEIKAHNKNIRCVFGGRHVTAVPECLEMEGVDVVVFGPIYGTLDRIVNSKGKELIHGMPISPAEMFPARREYYDAIPRMSTRHTKMIMSHFGCAYSCSYCSTEGLRKHYGAKVYNEYWLQRRPVMHMIEEAKIFLEYPTKEVTFEDDDILMGNNVGKWLEEFSRIWKKEIDLPINANVTPVSVLKVSDKILEILSNVVVAVNMGVQAAMEESLKLFNRSFQKEENIKGAFDRLKAFGIKTRFDLIIGLPVEDPVGDALETIKLAQRAGPGTYVGAAPLMLYPGTKLYNWCVENNIPFNEECTMEFHTGVGSVKFDEETTRKLKNIKKLSSMFVKYNIDEHWMKALIEMDMSEYASRKLSECLYYDSILFRLGEGGVRDFDKILEEMHFKY